MLAQLVPIETINRLKEAEVQAIADGSKLPDEALTEHQMAMRQLKRDRQARFLELLQRCGSPAVAARLAGIDLHSDYAKWRQRDWRFAEALNEIVTIGLDEAMHSAVNRATGYLKQDESTESGFVEDATGKPIRFGASDTLQNTLLKRWIGDPDEGKPKAPVSITLNFGAFRPEQPPTVSIEPGGSEPAED